MMNLKVLYIYRHFFASKQNETNVILLYKIKKIIQELKYMQTQGHFVSKGEEKNGKEVKLWGKKTGKGTGMLSLLLDCP